MRILLDTNILLEVLLQQEKSNEAQALLSMIVEHEFYISDFSLHSIGVLLFRYKKQNVFEQFVRDLIINAGTQIVALTEGDMREVVDVSMKFRLDFDDAYQYVAARKYGLTLISYDNDFDRIEKGRKSPAEIVKPGG